MNTEEASSAANNKTQGVDPPLNVVNNEILSTDGLTTIANNEIPGVEGLATSGQGDIPLSGHEAAPAYFIGPMANPALAVETRYVPKDVKDPMAVHGSCGLYNLGNTCFMNAGIQCLASCPPLLKHFFEQFQLTDGLRNTLTGAFYLLLCKMWSGKYSLVQPRHFKDMLGFYHPQFQDYRQHDCQEFLALLLDTFHEQLNRITPDAFSPASQPPATSSDAQGQGHLNNEDLVELGASPGKADQSPESASNDVGSKLLCPETLSSEEEHGGPPCMGEVSPRLSQGQSTLASEAGQGRSSLKRASSCHADTVMTSLISEDSNHSTVSAHSTDSEQSSAFKRLKIESDNTSQGSASVLSSVSESCDQKISTADAHSNQVPAAPPGASGGRKSVSDDSTSAGAKAETMEMSPPTNPSIPQRKCVRLDIPAQSQGALASAPCSLTQPCRGSYDNLDPRAEETGQDITPLKGPKKFNNTDERSAPGVASSESPVILSPTTTFQNDLPPMTSSPQDSSQTNPLHFYCKETKTLNTNVLVSNYAQGDVAVDSEKFAKVDNRSQVPVSKEVNLLQEALHGMEEDKVEKVLIGKTLGSGTTPTSIISSAARSRDKADHSSNLRTVKTRNHSGILRKPTTDPNLLNNSYDYEDEVVVGYSSLVGTSLQKGSEPDSVEVGCVKPDLDDVVGVREKMELAAAMVSSEVEKNVQMQALSKFKATITKSNIREDISDKASTSESTETEDMEAEAESSASEDEKEEEEEEEPVSRGSVMGGNSALPNPARCYTAADVAAANAAWELYKARNNSVVVDTFQGQFKSTVVCSECDHVSVTYEPFMYLSLPIPHAMERQICVVFVRPHKSTVRYMVTLHKNDKVQRLRRELQTMTATENNDVILAEVLDNHISRLLEDNVMLRYVNDTTRTIHAFQMLPPPEIPLEQNASTDEHHFSSTHSIPSPVTTSSTPVGSSADISRPLTIDISGGQMNLLKELPSSPLLSMDKVNAMLNASGESARSRSPFAGGVISQPESGVGVDDLEISAKVDDGGGQSQFATEDDFDQSQPPVADPMLIGTGMWEWNNRDDLVATPPPHVSAPPTSPTSEHSGSFPTDLNLHADYSTEAMFPQSPSSMDVEMDHIPSTSDFASSQMWPGGEEVGGGKGGGDVGGGASGLMDQWQTCAICLEELMDSQLLTHQTCSGVFCHTCLEMSAKHSGDLANCCPICLCPVDVSQDFVPLASSSTVKCKVRILALPVTFRQSSSSSSSSGGDGKSSGELRLVCGPRLTYVASQLDASALYALVDRVVPFAATYSLHFTDGQGLRCSRCEYGAHCEGCEVAKEGEVTLQPGDNLTVHFTEGLASEEVEAKTHVSDDASLERLRSTDPISIYDCFEAFTQSEVLDEHNPWYCPCCCRNQCAKKTMTVWRYPDNLIIHLKRFVYEDLSSTKIDNRVVFPHTDLDVTRFLAGPSTSFNVYDLYSIVCHYGGANSGHYTAFSCHPVTNEWYNYNDETVAQQRPGDGEFDNSYVLFFKRQGPQLEFDLVKDVPYLEEDEVDDFTATTSMAVVPYQSPPSSSPAEQSAIAVVTFETDGFSVVSDSNIGANEMESNQNYDFYN